MGHPLEPLRKQGPKAAWEMKVETAQRVYGAGAAIRMEMERRVLSQFQRLPGLTSSLAGLDTVTGRDERLDLEDVLDCACARALGAARGARLRDD